ncbi:type II secretion system protein [Coraliomargarita sinensis]|uniref:type II secretion system protein n=1 Tax=Coraliomargarita sinensis TaxID=2174842 RepID=UPI001E5263B8|nr:prepilin-type N-terminal cleavage/methylation domain-containing protein [Coraliomargarita sinensis]
MPRLLPLPAKCSAFTLVEIMIVVVIIGLLAVMGIPALEKSRQNTYASRIANNMRVFSGAFETHALENGSWAPDGQGNNLPATVAPYLQDTAWYEEPIPGGWYDWEYDREGIKASISLAYERDFPEVFLKVDRILDDGNLGTGTFIKTGGRYFYILER